MIKNTKECTLETARKKVEASVRAQLAVCHVTGTTLATISVQKTQGFNTKEQIKDLLTSILDYEPKIQGFVTQLNTVPELHDGTTIEKMYTTFIITFQLER